MAETHDPTGVLRRRVAAGIAILWGIQIVLSVIPVVEHEPSAMVHSAMLFVAGWLFASGTVAVIREKDDEQQSGRSRGGRT